METGTSSDIEIISLASTYGEVNGDRINDFVPLSRSLFKTKMREMSPEEEDMLAMSSSQSSPGSGGKEFVTVSEQTSGTGGAGSDTNNPLGVQTLIKACRKLGIYIMQNFCINYSMTDKDTDWKNKTVILFAMIKLGEAFLNCNPDIGQSTRQHCLY